MEQNSKTIKNLKNVTKLKKSNYDKTQISTKLKRNKTQKLKLL